MLNPHKMDCSTKSILGSNRIKIDIKEKEDTIEKETQENKESILN
jgi:hypothetical protein